MTLLPASTSKKISITVIIPLISTFLVQCTPHTRKVDISTKAIEPNMVWSGSDFGLLYYSGQHISQPMHVSLVLLDINGRLKKEVTIPGLAADYKKSGRLTQLIWNSRHKHFAFAYATGESVYFFRYDSQLNMLGEPCQLSRNKGDVLLDISMTYNPVNDEYGLVFICRTNTPSEKQHIFFARLEAFSGNPKGSYPNKWTTLIKGKGIVGAEKTSICYDMQNEKYVMAYFNNRTPMVRYFTSPTIGNGFPISAEQVVPENIIILSNPASDRCLVLQVVENGKLTGFKTTPMNSVEKFFEWPTSVDRSIGISTTGFAEKEAFVLAVSENDAVKSYLIDSYGQMKKSLHIPKARKYSFEPSIALVGTVPYIVWNQNKKILFSSLSVEN